MSREHEGDYASKHQQNEEINPEIAEKIYQLQRDKTLGCGTAHLIAKQLNVEPIEVGKTMDLMEIKIEYCLLGLFGWPNKRIFAQKDFDVPHDVETKLLEQSDNGKISCKNVWELADTYNLTKLQMAQLCDKNNIKVSPCQLGAF